MFSAFALYIYIMGNILPFSFPVYVVVVDSGVRDRLLKNKISPASLKADRESPHYPPPLATRTNHTARVRTAIVTNCRRRNARRR